MSDQISTTASYKDEDLVYVDPETRTVVGPVEWSKSGNPKPLEVREKESDEKDKKEERRRSGRNYPEPRRRSPGRREAARATKSTSRAPL